MHNPKAIVLYLIVRWWAENRQIISVSSPGVYPFLSILALREIGPEVQNQQQSVLSFVPACGDWKSKRQMLLICKKILKVW